MSVDFSDSSPFKIQKKIEIPESSQFIFVSDMFSSEYAGGAELTTDAIIDSSAYDVYRLKSKDVSMEVLKQGHQKHWVFCNFAEVDARLIPTIVSNLSYSVVEYDYKFCKYRSVEKHESIEGTCNCADEIHGKLVSALMYGARSLWWMSHDQMMIYHKIFPFLAEKHNEVLSSIFDLKTLSMIEDLRSQSKDEEREGWVVLDSPSWIKGADDAKKWCDDNDEDSIPLWNVPYDEMLQKLSKAEGFVCLPKGPDTCPRAVIEAKLLGCKLQLNDNVQHASEEWFDTDDIESIKSYLQSSPGRFWDTLTQILTYHPTLSGYTTTLNSVQRGYPFKECIRSMMDFCDEVVVVDAGSTDGTWEILQKMSDENDKLIIHQEIRDLNHPRFALKVDGLLKALARSLCTGDFCWQMDNDEIVHEVDYVKIHDILGTFPQGCDLLALPVIEYWGGIEKVRMDINPWKWRLSRNSPHITHGPPANLRLYDSNGDLYCAQGTDSCDYIRLDNYEPIQFLSFYTDDVHKARMMALHGNEESKASYQVWFNQAIMSLPSVFHFSWWNMDSKIKAYRDHWHSFWASMYNQPYEDTAENNVMFDTPWSEVTDDMISERGKEISKKLGGWIWHQKWDGVTQTDHMYCDRTLPSIIKEWAEENKS